MSMFTLRTRAARQLVTWLVLALLAAPFSAQEPPPRVAVETVVRRFYSAYASGDLDGLMTMWDPGSPSLPAFGDETAPVLRARCMTLHEVTIDSVELAGDRATVGVHVLLSKHGRTMPERYDPHSATLELIRRGGEWRVTRWTSREEAFVDRLLAARNDAEREALLQAEPRLLTLALDRALCRRGLLATNQWRLDDAATLLKLGTTVASAIGDLSGQSLATGLDSVLHRVRPERDLAVSLDLAFRREALVKASSDPDAISRASNRVGRTLYSLGRPEEALPWFQRAFSLRDELEDDSIVSVTAGQIAQIHGNRGDHHASMYYSEIARATARDDFARFGAEMNLGGEYVLGQGDCGLGVAHLQRSIELARKAGSDGVTGATWILAHCYLSAGQGQAALRLTSEALAKLGPNPDPDGAPNLLIVRSRYFASVGRLDKAEADLLEAIRLARLGGNAGAEGGALTELASLRLRQRRYIEARTLAAGAVGRAKGFAPGPLLVEARAERHLGRRGSAYRILRRLIETTEENAAALTSDEHHRQSFFESRAAAYV